MIRSTFYGFTTAFRGLKTAQKQLDVTGQNVTNSDTEGYTRQRADLYSVSPGGYASRYGLRIPPEIGNGVEINSITQMRDKFLDVRFRRESSSWAEENAKVGILNDMESIFDEIERGGVADGGGLLDSGGLIADFGNFVSKLQTLSKNPESGEFDSIVRDSALTLTDKFNHYAKQIETIREQEEYNLKEGTAKKVDYLIKNIAELNKTIRRTQVAGGQALELKDNRNVMLDELSKYMKLEVTYTPNTESGIEGLENISIEMVGNNGDKEMLIKDSKYAAISVVGQAGMNSTIDVVIDQTGLDMDEDPNKIVNMDSFKSTGLIQGKLDMLNRAGVFENPSTKKRGINFYENMLDKLADKFANTMNELNDKGGSEYLFSRNDGIAVGNTNAGQFTAKNITISENWLDGNYGITTTKKQLSGDNSGQNDNVLKIINTISSKMDYTENVQGGPPKLLFRGTFQQYLSNISNDIALDINATANLRDNYASVMESVNKSRDSISSVSLDEEGMNMMKFQKAYNASARFMTVLDEAIDKIINGMGIVGR